ncbi:septum site-determining protein Ssd [Tessaracoccus sp. Z1128]
METPVRVLLCAKDPSVIEAVEVTAAALELPVQVARDADSVGAHWAAAGLRLVSTEVAARWSSAPAGRAYLVGTSPAELARCSAELELPVLPLPDTGGRLAAVLARARTSERQRGSTVALVGATGGLGVSTLALALGLTGARQAMGSAVVDLAASSGGLDLAVGAEAVEGVRWADLAGAHGELGEVAARLPAVAGMALLAQSRQDPGPPSPGSVSAVVSALARSHRLVVLDCGRDPAPLPVDHTVLVVGADVRSVAAARMLGETRGVTPSAIVVRHGPGRTLPEQVICRTLVARSLGRIDQHRALPRLAELGLHPVGGPARRYAAQVAAVLRELTRG